MKKLLILMAAPLAVTLGVPGLLAWGMAATPSSGASGPEPAAPRSGIPPAMVERYLRAAAVCPGLSWTVLAAIGTVESANGTASLPGVRSGQNQAGAEGPMQFEPATFARYAVPVPPGGADPPSPYDPTDAVFAAARMLCADHAAAPGGLPGALLDYNHAGWYVREVEAVATRVAATYRASAGIAPQLAVAWALDQIGTPYRWGGESPGGGFDCSGLVQAAWAVAGVQLPRVAAAQFAAGPLLPAGTPLQPGDLVFFAPPGGGVAHVGMVVGSGQMVDAPHAGTVVRVEPYPGRIGGQWGGDILVGATRPGGY